MRPNSLNWLMYTEPMLALSVVNTSSSVTPICLALSRSMSRYSCGVLARKVVKTRASPGWALAFCDDRFGRFLQGLQAHAGAVVDLQLKAARLTQARAPAVRRTRPPGSSAPSS